MSLSAGGGSLGWGVCEVRILERIMYKNKNQHRKTSYYHKLMAVRRAARQLSESLLACGAAAHAADGTARPANDEADTNTDVDADEMLAHTIRALRSTRSSLVQSRLTTLCHILVHSQACILRASRPLYGLLGQTYFMSFAMTALAALARLYATQRAALGQVIDARLQAAQVAAASSTTPFTLAEGLRRAMRAEDDECAWVERCHGCDIFEPVDAATGATAVAIADSSADGASSPVASDGDSDEDEEVESESATAAPRAHAATLPPQLSFFSPPTKTGSSGKNATAAPAARDTHTQKTTASGSRTPMHTPRTDAAPDTLSGAAFRTPSKLSSAVSVSLASGSAAQAAGSATAAASAATPRTNKARNSMAAPGSSTTKTSANANATTSNPLVKPAASLAAPSSAVATKAGLKRKPQTPLSPATDDAHATKSLVATVAPAKKKARLVATAAATATSTTLTQLASPAGKQATNNSDTASDFLSLSKRPTPQIGTSTPAKKKVAKKKARVVSDSDEMDDIFG